MGDIAKRYYTPIFLIIQKTVYTRSFFTSSSSLSTMIVL